MAKVGRNRPCPCGSGKKFKKCCLAKKDARRVSTLHPEFVSTMKQKMRQMDAERVQREKQQGLGRGIISAEFKDYRFVAVASKLYYSKSWRTFHDFLRGYFFDKFGKEWIRAEHAKSEEQRHTIVRWYDQSLVDIQKLGSKLGDVISGPMTGSQRAFLNLAYNIYLIAHNADGKSGDVLVATYVDRLKSSRADDFLGKLFETYAAAAFIKAGFTLEYEDEADGTSSHVEFVATDPRTKKRFSVEVKTRVRNSGKEDEGPADDVKRLRVASKLNKALTKAATHARVVMIEVNVPDVVTSDSLKGWPMAALEQIRYAQRTDFPDGTPKPSAYVIVTNHAFHNNLPALDVGAQVLFAGFQMPDFGPDVEFRSYKAVLESRERHQEIFALVDSMRTHYEIPSTFDGENPALAFRATDDLPRLKFGQWYLIPTADGTEVPGRLYEATVMESEKVAYCIHETATGEHLMVSVPISDAELEAYRRHPSTFFGEVRHVGGRAETCLDLCDFFYETYKNSRREKLLDFLASSPDIEDLKKLSQKDLAITYSERCALAAFHHKGARMK